MNIYNKMLKILLFSSFMIGMNLFASSSAFIIKVQTDNDGSSSDIQFSIPATGDYDVDCDEDGIYEVTGQETTYTCEYHSAGTKIISIKTDNSFRIYFNDEGDKEKILEVLNWGDTPWYYMHSAFEGTSNLRITASDVPDLSRVWTMQWMFKDATSLDDDIGDWNVSAVENMYGMFEGATSFNQDIGAWDVSNVTNMATMFYGAESFNKDIGNWDVSGVAYMDSMFDSAYAFDQDIGEWDVSGTSTRYMFYSAIAFDQNISDWNISSGSDIVGMFSGAEAFNQDISDWNVSAITDMRKIFSRAISFDQNISNWDVSNVTDMSGMFSHAELFNQDIGDWDVSGVTDMSGMFSSTRAFNQDIGDWNVSGVTNMSGMFETTNSFNQDISAWDVSSVGDVEYMFEDATISVSNYDNLLKAWNRLDLVDGLEFDLGMSRYCKGKEARDQIIEDDSWYFSDSGESCAFYITTSSEVSVDGSQTYVVDIDTITEDEDSVEYSIVGGADKDKFSVDSDNGRLSFRTSPDIDNPTDRNGDNIYRVQIKAENADISLVDYQTMKVKVEEIKKPTLVPIILYLLN